MKGLVTRMSTVHLQQDVSAGSPVGYILVHALVFTCSLTKLVDTDNMSLLPQQNKRSNNEGPKVCII